MNKHTRIVSWQQKSTSSRVDLFREHSFSEVDEELSDREGDSPSLLSRCATGTLILPEAHPQSPNWELTSQTAQFHGPSGTSANSRHER